MAENLPASAAVLADQSHRDKIRVSGKDRTVFLNNMLTNDILFLKIGGSCRALLLSAQGRCLADFRVFIFNDFILLDTEPGLAKTSIVLLDRFVIAEDVQFADVTPDYAHLSLEGPAAGDIFLKLKFKLPAHHAAALVPTASFSGESEMAVFMTPQDKPQVLRLFQENGVAFCDEEAHERRRIANKIPRFKKDFDEGWFLNETGLEETAASETKGCYPGQEVVARLKTYGGVKRKLWDRS